MLALKLIAVVAQTTITAAVTAVNTTKEKRNS